MSKKLRCSFCGKSEDDVNKLVAGPSVYICDACVKIATEIMEHEGPPQPRTSLKKLRDHFFGSMAMKPS